MYHSSVLITSIACSNECASQDRSELRVTEENKGQVADLFDKRLVLLVSFVMSLKFEEFNIPCEEWLDFFPIEELLDFQDGIMQNSQEAREIPVEVSQPAASSEGTNLYIDYFSRKQPYNKKHGINE